MRQGWIVAPPMTAAGSGASKFTDARNNLRVSWVTAAWGSHRDGLMASIVCPAAACRTASLPLICCHRLSSSRSAPALDASQPGVWLLSFSVATLRMVAPRSLAEAY
jgi:hypothetical protein